MRGSFEGRLALLASDFKAARRSLTKHKAFTAITAAGLAVGAAACLLVSLYLNRELSYDNYHPNGDRVFRLLVKSSFTKGRPSPSMSPLAAPALRNGYPEVEAAARLIRAFRTPLFKRGAEVFPENGFFYAEPELFEILAIPFLRGRPDGQLFRPGTMILCESLAVKYFGPRDPLGQTLVVDGSPLEIVGIVRDAPANTHLKYRGFFPFQVYASRLKAASWTHYDPHTYLRVRPDTAIEAFGAKIARLSGPHLDGQEGPDVGTFLTAGGLALAMAMLSVGWKSFRAARANPVESLRSE
jgi:putative ABC transport system permease protein